MAEERVETRMLVEIVLENNSRAVVEWLIIVLKTMDAASKGSVQWRVSLERDVHTQMYATVVLGEQ